MHKRFGLIDFSGARQHMNNFSKVFFLGAKAGGEIIDLQGPLN